MLLERHIRETDARCRERFFYVADKTNKDTWRSHADKVLAGESWSGDCDDLTSTVLDLLGRDGFPLERRYRLLVATPTSEGIDHMVGCVHDSPGKFWIVGDTFGPCYPATTIRHRVIAYQRMDRALENPISGKPWSPMSYEVTFPRD